MRAIYRISFLALLASGAFGASVAVTAAVDPEGIPFGRCADAKTGDQTASCAPANSFPVGYGSYIGISSAQATFGSLHVLASSAATGHDPRVQIGGGGASSAQAVTNDNLTVTNGPKVGFLRIRLNIAGSLSTGGDSGLADANANLFLNGVQFPGFPKQGAAGSFATSTLYDLPYTAGIAALGLRLSTATYCATVGGLDKSCTALADLSHSVDITGVAVLDSAKNLVPQAGVLAESGFTYPALTIFPTADSASGPLSALVLKYSSPNGFAHLSQLFVLFSGSVDHGEGACFIRYDQAANKFYLRNDANTADLSPLAPGGSGSLSNKQCTLKGNGTLVSGAGPTLTLTLNLSFTASFGVAQSIFMYAADDAGQNSGWVARGTTVPVSAAPPTADSVSGVVPGVKAQILTLKYSSANGYAYLSDVTALTNGTLASAGACWVLYDKPSNLFYLANDKGDGVVGLVAPGAAASVSNSRCTLNGTGSSATGTGNTLTVVLNLTFPAGLGPADNVFGYALDVAGMNSGWRNLSSPLMPVSVEGLR